LFFKCNNLNSYETILIALFVIFSFTSSAQTQTKKELKRLFINGEFSLIYKEYKEALPSFMALYDAGRRDANIKHRIGLCYLNIPNQKEKAIIYLVDATENISLNYNVGLYTERNAPIETYLYLGQAYRVTRQLEEAIEAFTKYKELLSPDDKEKHNIVDAEITACKNALELNKIPTSIIESNLGRNINSNFNNINPLVSEDEETIVFVSQLRFYDAIFSSKKRDGRWLPARNISLDFNSEHPLIPVYLTKDGNTLYLQSNDNDDFNLYTSKFIDGLWQQPEKLNNNINSSAAEMYACVSDDGKTLYFTSDRKGGFGGFDIYKSEIDIEGNWQKPVNLGGTINTSFDEVSPFITKDNKTLYFSSQGHFNIGGFDIYKSTKSGSGWSKPENLGFPFNTTDDDIFFFPLKNGTIAYYSKFKESGYGDNDIYRIQIFERENIPEREKELNIQNNTSNN
jgi:tetratricopeptide (TPR) repeat protein